jgi:hypothetical protein
MNKPASAPDVVPPHEPPPADPKDEPSGEGTNATIHHPDDKAEQHPVRGDRRTPGPYVAGND